MVEFKTGTYNDVATFKAAMSGVMLYYELDTPVVTDISDLLPTDNLIPVEAGGTVTFVNEYEYDVPNEVVFHENANKRVGAAAFIGDLKGQAASALRDGEGNVISDTYVTNARLEEALAALAASLTGSAAG